MPADHYHRDLRDYPEAIIYRCRWSPDPRGVLTRLARGAGSWFALRGHREKLTATHCSPKLPSSLEVEQPLGGHSHVASIACGHGSLRRDGRHRDGHFPAGAGRSRFCAFRPNTAHTTTGWIIYTLIASFFAAIAGGAVTGRLAQAHRRSAVIGLATLVFVLGILSAMGNSARTPAEVLPPEVINDVFKRAAEAVQPTGYAWAVPFVGAIGALIGGGVLQRSP